MKFPIIGDIATVSVISLDIDDTLSHAIELMIKHEHRNIVVVDNENFSLLHVMDIIKKQSLSIDLNVKLRDLDLLKIPVIERHKNVLDALHFIDDKSEHICVINRDKSLYGFISHSDIISNIDPDTLMDNYRLQDFLKIGRKMKIVSKEETTSDVLKNMVDDIFDNVVIVEDSKPIGILTTKDIMYIVKNKEDISLPIKTYMSSPVDVIENSSSIKVALKFLSEKHYKRVVVVDEQGYLSGVIAQKELISLTYSRWAMLMKEYHEELSEINSMLENKNKEYEIMASTDSLTGLYNRHKFSELYLSSYKSMIQRDNSMSILIVDIDFFKKVNDTYGHIVGDKVLVQVAHVLLRSLRNIDIVCRWGGEEFVALLPTVDLARAEILADKIRVNTQELVIDTVGQITISIGVSKVNEGDIMEDAIQRADEALYIAKDSGRNCVKVMP